VLAPRKALTHGRQQQESSPHAGPPSWTGLYLRAKQFPAGLVADAVLLALRLYPQFLIPRRRGEVWLAEQPFSAPISVAVIIMLVPLQVPSLAAQGWLRLA
jgi:hypothetical protein